MKNHSLPHECDKHLKLLVLKKLISQKGKFKQTNLNKYI